MNEPDRQGFAVRIASRILRTRWLVRAPIPLYRIRLGGIFGRRLLMLEHVGRTSGAPRYVILEVVDRPSEGGYIVASGFGTKAQWFRNVVANPHVRVAIGGHRPVAVIARVMSAEETRSALSAYALAQPKAWEQLKPVFEDALGAEISEDGTSLPMVHITPE